MNGFLGDRRVPLPACAYTAIRKAFPSSEPDEYVGFEFDEDESSDEDDSSHEESLGELPATV